SVTPNHIYTLSHHDALPIFGVPAGYGIARMKAHRSAVVILIARITPGLSYLIPLFLLFQWLGLLGTLLPQIIIHLVVTVPIVIRSEEHTSELQSLRHIVCRL